MIKEFRKIIIMAVSLLILVVGLVVILTTDMDFGVFRSLGVASISDKKVSLETLVLNEVQEREKHETAIDTLEATKNQYEAAKKAFDNIDKSTVELVQEATMDERYFIEYLWIVLGNYAKENNLLINIITPGSKSQTIEGTGEDGNATSTPVVDTSVSNDAVKIIVKGRYANVADFVYEVENDKELKFKLDNIKMTYVKNNVIEATFNVLSLKVKK